MGAALSACAVALVAAAAVRGAWWLVMPAPWVVGLILLAMLGVAAQPAATRLARATSRVLTLVGCVGALAAWAAWLGTVTSDEKGPTTLDAVVDVGASTAALSLAALLVVAVSASSRSGVDDPEQGDDLPTAPPAVSAGA